MNQPFELLLGHLYDHPRIGPHLWGPAPQFSRIEPDGLSSGELVLLGVALAIHNGNRDVTVADLSRLDGENRRRVLDALAVALLVEV